MQTIEELLKRRGVILPGYWKGLDGGRVTEYCCGCAGVSKQLGRVVKCEYHFGVVMREVGYWAERMDSNDE